MKYIKLAMLIALFYSCSDPKNPRTLPDNLIPVDTMSMILKDMMLIEAHLQNNYTQIAIYKEAIKKSGKDIFNSYKVSPTRFEISMNYYGSHQDQMIGIYTLVDAQLKKQAKNYNPKTLKSDTTVRHTSPFTIRQKRFPELQH